MSDASAVTPEQLAVAAKALGYVEIWHSAGRWYRPDGNLGRREIGSDADLCAAIRRALLKKYGDVTVTYKANGNCYLHAHGEVSRWTEARADGPDELSAHLAACIAAMGAT
jgi:hypothetical protein